ncbi:MAG TPA: hypothetical protein VLX92_15465 [Kofleriaceae bacterium]|nr:hypothetical protein [Kofleriaceae bacterium]
MRRALVVVLAACSTNATPQPQPVPTLPSCVPNRDGTITADELPIALGATLDYYAGDNRTVDQVAQGGVWDLSQQRPDDTVVALGPVALDTQWYAAEFPSGAFVVDAGDGLDGIYHQDDQALWLDGTASQQENPAAGKTLVAYPEPVAVLRFPLADGAAWSTTAPLAAATIDGLPFVGSDKVDVAVAGTGRLDVPYVEFSPTLRVQTLVTRTPSTGAAITKRTTIFMFECFGEIARAESNPDEPQADFTQAAYLRRFALGVTP